jgi:acetyltransferase-like isoleucine patch superfamily enzyme
MADAAWSARLPSRDYVLNHIISRIPTVGARTRAYAALGVQFDDRASTMVALGVELWAGSNLSVGARSAIGQRCYLDARGGIRIDSDVSLSREACVLTAAHDLEDLDFRAGVRPVRIERHSWLGVRAVVLPGVHIGEGAVVAAGAVVTGDVEPYTVVAGTPAKPIRTRPSPMSYELDWRPSWY